MSTSVSVNTYTHSVTYVTDNILKNIKDIIRLSGLDPSKFVENWNSYEKAVSLLLESEHLLQIRLEVYNSQTGSFITRWDFDISYTYVSDNSDFWVDTDLFKYHINKLNISLSQALYSLVLKVSQGAPAVDGWGVAIMRSTDGFVRQSIGSAVEHSGLGASAAYWREA